MGLMKLERGCPCSPLLILTYPFSVCLSGFRDRCGHKFEFKTTRQVNMFVWLTKYYCEIPHDKTP